MLLNSFRISRRCLHCPRRLFSIAIAASFAALLPGLFAAEEGPKDEIAFDLPAGEASVTLKRFAAQANREIVFDADAVGNVETNQVKGPFTVEEALEKLLSGTPLSVSRDARTGALAVVRDSTRAAEKNVAVPRESVSAENPPDHSSGAETDDVTRLNTMIVTGSNIPTAADATDVPVVVFGPQELLETGINANVMDLLRKRLPSIAGRSSAGSANGANTSVPTSGGTQLAIRNLSTLVLINGRRMATSGANAVAGNSFVDVNMIPVAAIARMEVLADGASAIYGSDAVGGVVNIILKSDYRGVEIGGRYAVASGNGNYNERSAYVVAGAGSNGVNLTVSGSWSRTTPLFEKDRPFIATNPKTGSNFPGYVGSFFLSPSLNSPSQKNPVGTAATASSMASLVANGTYLAAGNPSIVPFDAAPYITLLLKSEQRAGILTGSAELLGKKLVLFGDLLYATTKTFNQDAGVLGNLQSVTVPAGSPFNPLTTAATGVVIGSVSTPMQVFNDARSFRVTAGLRGDINPDWNWEGGYTYSDNRLTENIKNEVFGPNVPLAVAGGYDASGNAVAGGGYSKVLGGFSINGPLVLQPALDPFARAGANPASLANVYGTEVLKMTSKLVSSDLKLVGTPFALPAGKVGLAVGAATRKETLTGTPDNNSFHKSTDPTKQNWLPGTIFDPFTKSRTIDSLFGEVRVPITSASWHFPAFYALDISLAGRIEKYSDAGRSKVPKIGFRWQPLDEQLTLRFTYSKSFTAPTLYEEYGPPSVERTSSDLLFTSLSSYNDPRLKGLAYFSGDGNNPGLKPSTAISRSMGVVFSPKAIPHLTLSVNYINVFTQGLAGGLGTVAILQSVDALGSASPLFGAVAIGGIPGKPGSSQTQISTPGSLHAYLASPGYAGDLYILDHHINIGGVHQEAIDIGLEYEIPTNGLGQFTFSHSGTYFKSFLVQLSPTQAFYEIAGYATQGRTMTGSIPKYRAYSTLDWRFGSWGVTIGNLYATSMTDIKTSQIPSVYLQTNPVSKVSSYLAWDVQASYTVQEKESRAIWSFLRGLMLSVGVNNVTNRMPPLAPLSQPPGSNYVNADISSYSAIGRLFFISANIKY